MTTRAKREAEAAEATKAPEPKEVTVKEAFLNLAETLYEAKNRFRLSEPTLLELLRMFMAYQRFPEDSITPLADNDSEDNPPGKVFEVINGGTDGSPE